jgi:hypothetical protein
MSVLTLIQNTVNELGLPKVSSVVSSSGALERQLLAIMERVGKDLRSEYNWPELSREKTITLVDAQDSYAFPADFDHHIFRTHWDRTNQWELVGPLSPQEWQWRQSGISQVAPRREYRVKGVGDRQFHIFPTPDSGDAGEIIAFEYQSKNWVRPRTWAESQSYSAEGYTFNNGNYYQTTNGGTTGSTAPTHTTGTVSDGGVDWTFFDGLYEKPLEDSDILLIDEDLIGRGVQWQFMQQKGLQWEVKYEQYQKLLLREVSALKSARTLSFNRRRNNLFITPRSVPDTGFGNQ